MIDHINVLELDLPEIGKSAEQELPPAALTRSPVNMATGAGKTLDMA
jgi:hypothetical protein